MSYWLVGMVLPCKLVGWPRTKSSRWEAGATAVISMEDHVMSIPVHPYSSLCHWSPSISTHKHPCDPYPCRAARELFQSYNIWMCLYRDGYTLLKHRWCEGLYFVSQASNMKHTVTRPGLAMVTNVASEVPQRNFPKQFSTIYVYIERYLSCLIVRILWRSLANPDTNESEFHSYLYISSLKQHGNLLSQNRKNALLNNLATLSM